LYESCKQQDKLKLSGTNEKRLQQDKGLSNLHEKKSKECLVITLLVDVPACDGNQIKRLTCSEILVAQTHNILEPQELSEGTFGKKHFLVERAFKIFQRRPCRFGFIVKKYLSDLGTMNCQDLLLHYFIICIGLLG
jgi:hypothetical protein